MICDQPELVARHLKGWIRVNVLHRLLGSRSERGFFIWVTQFVDGYKKGSFTMSCISRMRKANVASGWLVAEWLVAAIRRGMTRLRDDG